MSTLSPSVHEMTIRRHFLKDTDDPVLLGLHDAVKLSRESATKAASVGVSLPSTGSEAGESSGVTPASGGKLVDE